MSFLYSDFPIIEHFNFKELIKTDTGIENIPTTFYTVCNLLHLAEVLEEIREYVGVPIIINSAFRTLDVNAAVGGVENSLHTYGLAADITCVGSSFETLKKCCKEFKQINHLSECIVHEDKKFIHIGIHENI